MSTIKKFAHLGAVIAISCQCTTRFCLASLLTYIIWKHATFIYVVRCNSYCYSGKDLHSLFDLTMKLWTTCFANT
ncbi:hypothetical protein EDD18DRAFT_1140850 [Armillaria luteobubalina]|uniref:Uncharacterized protein n=1 Tax=Armillaria luteobubalina TaxID=153913 RepID=A0AA39V233_9AGAR|nr:hypothetical protein EDD18DRAFT_1140850 [Armillaria luteobubalina]